MEVILCFDLDSSLITETAAELFYINLTQYTLFKWTVIVWLHELSECIYSQGKSCLVTTATNTDLVLAATLHCPCYDSADVVKKTMNSHGES